MERENPTLEWKVGMGVSGQTRFLGENDPELSLERKG